MAIDSRQKGQRAEYAIRDLLRAHTKLDWDRVPGSGGFGASHGLKGDIYLPTPTGKIAAFTIEVKHYKDDVITSNILNSTESQLEKFWSQTAREADQMNAKPMLIFKKDRSKWLVGVEKHNLPDGFMKDFGYFKFSKGGMCFYIFNFEQFLERTTQQYWVK